MRFLYTISIKAYVFAIHLAALFSAKARLWVKGRQDWKEQMQEMGRTMTRDNKQSPVIWFHCASLGEFEQGRPVLEKFRQEYPGWFILLTFFSPSGYEVRKDYTGADYVMYLPPDTPGNVDFFLDFWQPRLAVFVKYEFWVHYLKGLSRRQVDTLVVSAIFRPDQHFFRRRGTWFRNQLQHVSWFFVQDKASHDLLKRYGFENVVVSGDTRFDRVYRLSREPEHFPVVESFAAGNRVLVAGSTWPKDMAVLQTFIKSAPRDMKYIIAPHEVHEESLQQTETLPDLPSHRYSTVTEPVSEEVKVLIIDKIGFLSHLYQYGDVAFIGGGFGQGIHNILEAAAFGIPVLFGPNMHKFAEAVELIERGGAFRVHDGKELAEKLEQLLSDKEKLMETGRICRRYVEEKQGATAIILEQINKLSVTSKPHP